MRDNDTQFTGDGHAKKDTPRELIIAKLLQIDMLIDQGQSVGQATRAAGIREQSYYRWCKGYGELRQDQAKHLKELNKRKPVTDCEGLALVQTRSVQWLSALM